MKGSSMWQLKLTRWKAQACDNSNNQNILDDGSIQCRPKAKMLYISILEDLITDAITEEESTISISEKEDMSTGLCLLEKILYL